MKRKKRIVAYSLIILSLCAVYAILAKNGLSIQCPINALTGYKCAGCGNTRAALALLDLNIVGMLEYNLFFPFEMAYIFGVYCKCAANYLKNGRFSYHATPNFFDIAFLVLLVAWTIVRNITRIM